MDLADIPSIIDKCEEIVSGTDKLNRLLHQADFVEQKMTKLKSVFGASDSPALVLNTLILVACRSDDKKNSKR